MCHCTQNHRVLMNTLSHFIYCIRKTSFNIALPTWNVGGVAAETQQRLILNSQKFTKN